MSSIQDFNRLDLQYLYHNPCIVLIRGMVGSAKTSAGFRVVEKIHQVSPYRPIYYFVLDAKRIPAISRLLPSWIQYTDSLSMENLPIGSVLYCDEAWSYLSAKAHKSKEQIQEVLDNMALIRQRDQTLILIVQNLAMLDIDSFRVGYTLISKFCPPETISFERENLQDFLLGIQSGIEIRLEANPSLKMQQVGHVHTPYSPMINKMYGRIPGYAWGFHKWKLPAFWSEELSTFWGRV